MFEFCESELFPETLQNSEVASSSNCCYEEQSSYPTQISITTEMSKFNNNNSLDSEIKSQTITTTTTSMPAITEVATTRNNNLPTIFDDPTQDQIENDISASIDFTGSPSSFPAPHQYFNNNSNNNNNNIINNNHEAFNISSLSNQLSLGDMVNGYNPDRWTTTVAPPPPAVLPILGPPLPTSYEEDCLPSMPPSYIRLRTSQPSCSLIDPLMAPFLPTGSMSGPFSAENSGIFTNNGLMMGTDISHQELDFQGDSGGLFLPDNMQRVFNCSGDLQALSSESPHLLHGGANTTTLASEISSLEEPTFKVGKLSAEERKRKIHRYLKKRNERNFSKKIKYACRKTLADSRPRVRGRFAKNYELGEMARNAGSNQEDDIDEDMNLFSNSIPNHQRKVVKEEEDMESADIFAHISGVNSFKCNYPIQSWIN
ncbi:hypothetical protein CDL12_17308 [Handroanthus impetiginosus]|uniref:CCT domain-containing protein n=1 Tax=Handroanthus impetiginosus TaxID=429701 RepID=A0A2G9GXU5_9LAMI|nr:hypothetical protein CDL12_17308 [Handroanthus impetiginosus]